MQTQRDTQKHTHRHAHSEANLAPFEAKKTHKPLAISYMWSSTPHTAFVLLRLSTYRLMVLKLFLDFCPDFTEETGMLPSLNEATVIKYWGNEGTSQVKSISLWVRQVA